MNLLYTITGYPPSIGGAQFYAHSLASRMNQDHGVQVICQWDRNRTDWLIGTTLTAPSKTVDFVVDDVPVRRIGISARQKAEICPWVFLYYFWMSRAIRPISDQLQKMLDPFVDQAELVHNIRMGREPLSYATFEAARRRRIPFVFSPLHHPRWIGWRYREYLKLYGMADVLLALTDAEKQTLERLGVSEKKIFVTGMGPTLAVHADGAAFREKFSLQGPVVLFVGQLYPYKGYGELLQAAPYVWQKIPEATFVFIGPAVENSERHFQLSSDRRILRLGALELQEKTNALAACDILCVPSTQESFGGVYTEAWSFEKPVIGCAIPAVSEVISDGIDGYLVKEQNPVEIADRIIDLIQNPQRRETMGKAGLRKVKERYSWDRVIALTEEAYRSALCAA